MKLSVEYAILPKDGELVSGDAAFVRAGEDGVLFAVIDALGHGEHAAAAANVALKALADAPSGEDVRALVDRLHARLRGTPRRRRHDLSLPGGGGSRAAASATSS